MVRISLAVSEVWEFAIGALPSLVSAIELEEFDVVSVELAGADRDEEGEDDDDEGCVICAVALLVMQTRQPRKSDPRARNRHSLTDELDLAMITMPHLSGAVASAKLQSHTVGLPQCENANGKIQN